MSALQIAAPSMTTDEMSDVLAFLTAYRYYAAEVQPHGDREAGRRVFAAKGCQGCHDTGASRWQKLGPDPQTYHGRSAPMFLAQAMWNHRPLMERAMNFVALPLPKFEGREMDDLIAFLQADPATDAVRYFGPGSPRRGQALFTEKRCIKCHAIAGKGGRGGPDLGGRSADFVTSVGAVAGAMWNHSEGMAEEMKRRQIPNITFVGDEMVDVIAYLYFVNYATASGSPSSGDRVFAEKCSACHATSGDGPGPSPARLAPMGPVALIAAMWNHAQTMRREADARGVRWPRLAPGETADLAAFLVARRPQRD
jgi:cytochrome c2